MKPAAACFMSVDKNLTAAQSMLGMRSLRRQYPGCIGAERMPTCWDSLSGCSMLLWAMAGSATWRLRLLTLPSGWLLLAFYIVGNGI